MLALSSGFVPRSKNGAPRRLLLLLVEQLIPTTLDRRNKPLNTGGTHKPLPIKQMSISATPGYVRLMKLEELEQCLRVVLDSPRFSILDNETKAMVLLDLENGGEYAPKDAPYLD